MSVKRLRSESVVEPVPQDPRDMVKAGLPEPQSQTVNLAPAGRTLVTRRHPSEVHRPGLVTDAPPMDGH